MELILQIAAGVMLGASTQAIIFTAYGRYRQRQFAKAESDKFALLTEMLKQAKGEAEVEADGEPS